MSNTIVQRVEALLEKGLAEVETALHDALSVVESMFATDDGATLDVSVSDPAPAATDAPAA